MAQLIHTCYRIGDIDRSVAFYNALGFEEIGRMPIRDEAINVFMGLPDDGARLELTFNHGVDSYEMGTGYNHIAITADDLDATLGALAEQGIDPERPPYTVSENGPRLCFVRDPDGYRIELIERTGCRAGRWHPLRIVLGEIGAVSSMDRLRLAPLSREAVARLAAPQQAAADDLYVKTGGNPFFVTEALAAAGEEIPATVRDAVLGRAARLSPGARRLLDAIAVAGKQAELWLLDALAQRLLGASGGMHRLGHGRRRDEGGGVLTRARAARDRGVDTDAAPAGASPRALAALDHRRTAQPSPPACQPCAGDRRPESVLRFAPRRPRMRRSWVRTERPRSTMGRR